MKLYRLGGNLMDEIRMHLQDWRIGNLTTFLLISHNPFYNNPILTYCVTAHIVTHRMKNKNQTSEMEFDPAEKQPGDQAYQMQR